MKIAVIGQSLFGQEVYKELRNDGHTVVGVFTIPDKDGKADPLAAEAEKDGVAVFKFPRWRVKGQAIPEVVAQYKATGAELNVLPFCSQFIPMEVIDHPKHGSIIYHPSLLPLHRGASAINWTLIHGDKKGGFTVFWADDGLDTGPILLQRECEVEPNDTVNTIYKRFLFPEGVKGTVEAVRLIAQGKAPRITQPQEGATYECIQKKENAKSIHGMSTSHLARHAPERSQPPQPPPTKRERPQPAVVAQYSSPSDPAGQMEEGGQTEPPPLQIRRQGPEHPGNARITRQSPKPPSSPPPTRGGRPPPPGPPAASPQ